MIGMYIRKIDNSQPFYLLQHKYSPVWTYGRCDGKQEFYSKTRYAISKNAKLFYIDGDRSISSDKSSSISFFNKRIIKDIKNDII